MWWSQNRVLLMAALVLVCASGAWADGALRITLFGDSTSAPRKVSGRDLTIYGSLLETHFREKGVPVQVINASVGGATTEDARSRLNGVLRNQPDIVVIQFGINDAAVDVWKEPPADAPRVSLKSYRDNLRHIVQKSREMGAIPILMTPNRVYWTARLKQRYGKPPYDPNRWDGFDIILADYAQVVRELAKELNVQLVDIHAEYTRQGQAGATLLLDGMHPNDQGHALVLAKLVPVLEKLPLADMLVKAQQRPTITTSGITLHKHVRDMPHLKMGPFVRLSDGSILTVEDVNALISSDEGVTWQSYPIFSEGMPHRISTERAILRTTQGHVIVAFMDLSARNWTWDDKLGDAPGATLPTCVVVSRDEGRTWDKPQKLHDDWTGAIRDMIETRDGTIIFTSMMMRHDPGRHTVLTYRSKDGGKTWHRSNVVDLGGAGHHGGVSESTIEQLHDGKLVMLIRTNWMQFWRAESTDEGATWHPYGPAGIPASSAPAMLKRLSSGRLLLVWNRPWPDGQTSHPLVGGDRKWSAVPVSNHRAELSLALSDDDGKTWSKPAVIASKPGAWISYPYVFEAKPGELWITTMQGGLRVALNEKDFVTSGE